MIVLKLKIYHMEKINATKDSMSIQMDEKTVKIDRHGEGLRDASASQTVLNSLGDRQKKTKHSGLK